MLNNKFDRDVERLMNEESLSHSEAIAKLREGSKKKSAPAENAKGSDAEESTETPDENSSEGTVSIPAGLLPNVAVGKDVNLSISGKVKSKSGEMIEIETRDVNVGVREPMKASPEVARL